MLVLKGSHFAHGGQFLSVPSNSIFLVINIPLNVKSEDQLIWNWFKFNVFNSFGLRIRWEKCPKLIKK